MGRFHLRQRASATLSQAQAAIAEGQEIMLDFRADGINVKLDETPEEIVRIKTEVGAIPVLGPLLVRLVDRLYIKGVRIKLGDDTEPQA